MLESLIENKLRDKYGPCFLLTSYLQIGNIFYKFAHLGIIVHGKRNLNLENGCYEPGLFVFISFAVFVIMVNFHVNLQIKEQGQEDVQGSFKHLGIT